MSHLGPWREARLARIGLRAKLLGLHRDLFLIHKKIKRWSELDSKNITNLETMVIVLEDRRFDLHYGIDVQSIVRELIRAVTFRRHGGASTIDMQFVRTATGFKAHTLRRKIYEMLLSILIQYRYKKIVILRSYLNCAFFGSGLIGINKTSFRLFNKTPDSLSLEEAAFIAAMLVYPRPLKNGERWKSNVRRRAEYGVRVYVSNKNRFDKLDI